MDYCELEITAGGHDGMLCCYEHTESAEIPIKSRPAILVIPGGAYAMCSDREGEPVAIEFLNRGFNAHVVKYPCAPTRYPAQLVVAAAAMNIIRERAKQTKTDPKRVYAIGFSAGGHLCGMLANCSMDLPEIKSLTFNNFKPNAIALCYPVISYEYGHALSHENLLGGKDKAENCGWLNLDTSVTKNNPPAFIWTTATDEIVPPVNALSYAAAYNKLGLRYELHVFSKGRHGLSVADERTLYFPDDNNPHVAKWVDLFCEFLKTL